MNNDEKTSKFANNLADFYRTCLNKGNTRTSLNNEFRNIRAYIYLQLDMHDDSFDYEEEIDDAILDYECINLMLQPIVENAIGHGLELSDHCRRFIRITAGFGDSERKNIIIKIFNNGKPIEPEIAAAVMEGKKGYGFSNVVNRIKLYFGPEATLDIRGEQDGTVCTINIPARRWDE